MAKLVKELGRFASVKLYRVELDRLGNRQDSLLWSVHENADDLYGRWYGLAHLASPIHVQKSGRSRGEVQPHGVGAGLTSGAGVLR
jgi:hypothetical protein